MLSVSAKTSITIHPLGLLVGRSSTLTMAAARELYIDHAKGNPCKPNPEINAAEH
jgi:hypothetical protein